VWSGVLDVWLELSSRAVVRSEHVQAELTLLPWQLTQCRFPGPITESGEARNPRAALPMANAPVFSFSSK
jgi:hypothetical protein